jgi:lactoylglutathione lyase
MNVPNVREFTDRLIANGVKVDYQEHDWGTVAKFTDPDGNLCAFKDDATFEKQIKDN